MGQGRVMAGLARNQEMGWSKSSQVGKIAQKVLQMHSDPKENNSFVVVSTKPDQSQKTDESVFN